LHIVFKLSVKLVEIFGAVAAVAGVGSAVHDGADELLVVDVAVGVLVASKKLLHLSSIYVDFCHFCLLKKFLQLVINNVTAIHY
jgi:hypothetical protein